MSEDKKPKVGFVGVGRMGANMARRLSDLGYEIAVVFDRSDKVQNLVAEELGAKQVCNLSEVTDACDVVLTVVTDDEAMRSIFTATEDNLLSSKAVEGTTFINCATLSPEIHELIEEKAIAVGAKSLEACMASSITQAREGTLYLMIAGEEAVFNENKALLENLSTALRYVGEVGTAAKVKALVNMVMNINTGALAEGLALGDALGIDLKMLCEVFSQTGANSRVLETDAEDMIIRDHECYFSGSHAAKDSGIANALAEKEGVKVPLSQAAERQYQKMVELGLGELDKSGIAELTFKGRSSAQ